MKLLADENLRSDIVKGLRRRMPDVDIVRAQDVGLRSRPDFELLAWAGAQGRILVTHDRRTTTEPAYARVERGEPMPGVFLLEAGIAAREAIEELLLIIECSTPADWENRVVFLPL